MRFSIHLLTGLICLGLTACATAPKPAPEPETPVIVTPPVVEPQPQTQPQTPETTEPETPIVETPPITTPPPQPTETQSAFSVLDGWEDTDLRLALKAFQRSCSVFEQAEDSAPLIKGQPQYGTMSDWRNACALAQATPAFDAAIARDFFESEFLPVELLDDGVLTGTVTGYYQPEIKVSRTKTDLYSEAILALPSDPEVLTWPRSRINEQVAVPIAYGTPIEVFFMQIQGSGVMLFDDGTRQRAAYAENNGYPYTSIGRVLISRGELAPNKASKQDIENWMAQAGPEKARELMNQNERYIFFMPETIMPGEGPKGAMRVPLSDMASIAIDPSIYPYGLPVWLETQIPNAKGDYKGAPQNLLVITQDTGKAIRGEFRADLYFGTGTEAGDKAGVMKHPARWTLLLPFHLALQLASQS